MRYFWIDTDWDKTLNSPWDALWYEQEEALGCLRGSLPLAAVWKAPVVQHGKRLKRPDIYSFIGHYAVTKSVRDLWARVVREEAEFLPLKVPRSAPVFVVHPLYPVDFDDGAELTCNGVSGNITVVRKYSFTIDPNEFDRPRHLFRMRQAKASSGRDDGLTLSKLIVSEKIKRISEKAGITGIVFNDACSI